jgi:hypothetical protein
MQAMQNGNLMDTFFKVVFVWPLKIAFFLLMTGLAVGFAIMVISKLGSLGKDVTAIKERIFNGANQ